MLQYPDLTLDDVGYYWRGSVLLRESKGTLVPCTVGEITARKNYPIELIDMSTGKTHINLKLTTFVHTVLIHHPALGYGDYNGVPVYLSPRAGREKRKGLDRNNITALCPINWKAAVFAELKNLRAEAITILEATKTGILPKTVTSRYAKLRAIVASPKRRGLTYSHTGAPATLGCSINIKNDRMWASVIAQSVNNIYPSVDQALLNLKSLQTMGVSVSRDFALIKSAELPTNMVRLYHKLSRVGDLNISTGAVSYNNKLSGAATQALELAFNKIRR